MRKIAVSSKVPSRIRLSSCAEARSRPKGFSTMTRAPSAQPAFAELLDDRAEQHGRNGQVVRRPLRGAELLADAPETSPGRCSRRRRSAAGRTACRRPPDRARRASRGCPRPGLELVEVPAGLGHADDRHVEVAALHHRLQRREDLLVGQIAGGAEEDQGIGMGVAHGCLLHCSGRFFQVPAELDSAWPRAACPGSPPRRAS